MSKVDSDDTHSELSDAAPLPSVVPLPPKPPSPLRMVESEKTGDQSHDNKDDTIPQLFVNPEVVRLETQMDTWCLDLKRNVLVKFAGFSHQGEWKG